VGPNGKADMSEVQFEYSSVKNIRDSIESKLGTPVLMSTPWDSDRDGIVDQYNITLRFFKPLTGNVLKLKKVNLILAFDYELTDLIKMKMEGLAIIDVDTMNTALYPRKIITQGDLRMKQPNAL